MLKLTDEQVPRVRKIVTRECPHFKLGKCTLLRDQDKRDQDCIQQIVSHVVCRHCLGLLKHKHPDIVDGG